MPKSKNRRRRHPSRATSEASQSLLDDLSVEVQGDKVVPVPQVIDSPRSANEPLVEITATPQSQQPIVRVGRLRRPHFVEIVATETILAEAGRRQSKAEHVELDYEQDDAPSPDTSPTVATPCNTARLEGSGSSESAPLDTEQEYRQSPPEVSSQPTTEVASPDLRPASGSAIQRTMTQAGLAGTKMLATAKGVIGATADKIGDIRARQKAGALEKKAQEDASRVALQSTEAKGDLKRIASSLEAKSNGDGNGDGPSSSKARQLVDKGQAQLRQLWTTIRNILARNGIHSVRDVGDKIAASMTDLAAVAFAIRIGVGSLFVIGGWNKLSKLLSPANSDAIVASYTSTTGYINEFFMGYLFGAGSVLTPWSFLTALSTFELVTGLMLLAGLLVRPVALIYAFLLWTFVVSLPVVTTNGIDPGVNTYMAPALLVQIRDVALSGIMFTLFGLGSGIRSLDVRIFGTEAAQPIISWDVAGVLLRLSTAVVLIVGGAFAGMPNIKTFIEPGFILLAIGLVLLWGGRPARYAAAATCAVLFVYMMSKIGIDKGLLGSLNAIKRELALFAGAFVISARGCGKLWTIPYIVRQLQDGTTAAARNLGRADQSPEKLAT